MRNRAASRHYDITSNTTITAIKVKGADMKKILLRHARVVPYVSRTGVLLLLALMLVGAVGNARAETKNRTDFDHLKTGFPLDGVHARQKCEDCHVQGIFKGTPTQCSGCHTAGSRIASTSKPANHVPTALPCSDCHTSSASWIGARFSHMGVSPGTCTSCHGVTASGKPNKHIATTAQCDVCHRTSAWIPATFSHASVTPGTCTSCHGVTASGKPNGHIATTAQCDACHRTTAWIPASFSHANVTPGTCTSCHGVTASGKPNGHFITSRSCDACHSTNAWAPTLRYTHTSPAYAQHNAGVTCINCHTTKNEVVPWKYSTYKPDCAACHADKYKPGPHKKTESPTTIFYTVSELRNCSGSCHQYNDSSFTSIKKSRSGEHRATGGEF